VVVIDVVVVMGSLAFDGQRRLGELGSVSLTSSVISLASLVSGMRTPATELALASCVCERTTVIVYSYALASGFLGDEFWARVRLRFVFRCL
jgi:hypothetical protein